MKKIKKSEYFLNRTDLDNLLENFQFEKGLNEIKKFLKTTFKVKNTFHKNGCELLYSKYFDKNGPRLFINVLLENLKTKLKEIELENRDTLPISCAIAYIEEVMTPATKAVKEFKNLYEIIFDNTYWQSKGCVPVGIQKMQALLRRKYEEVEEVCITGLKDIVYNRPEKESKRFYFFTYKRDLITCKFYQAISDADSLPNLLESKKFQAIFEDRIVFYQKQEQKQKAEQSHQNFGYEFQRICKKF